MRSREENLFIFKKIDIGLKILIFLLKIMFFLKNYMFLWKMMKNSCFCEKKL